MSETRFDLRLGRDIYPNASGTTPPAPCQHGAVENCPACMRGEIGRLREQVEGAHKAIKATLLLAEQEWDFEGAHPHRAAVLRDLRAAISSTVRPVSENSDG